jgi:CheY-like chemotaxis protein
MGGIEATSQVRGLGFSGMIVGVTGDITVEDNARFLESGVNDVMLKPLLLPHVESILIGKLCIELCLLLFFSLIVALSSLFSF